MMQSVEESRQLTICSLCQLELTDPRSLPCLHTFCFHCLKKRAQSLNDSTICCTACGGKSSGQLDDLPRNSFVEKLIKINQLATVSNSQETSCDVCRQDDSLGVVMATHHCVNCAQNLCEKCSSFHGRSKASQHHRVVRLGVDLTPLDLRGTPQCDQHVDEPLKMFCVDCTRCICFLCYAEQHTGHRCQVHTRHQPDVPNVRLASVQNFSD